MSRPKSVILAVTVLVVSLFAWTGVAGARPMAELPPGLSAADWADIWGQIEEQLPGEVPVETVATESAPFVPSLLGTSAAQQAYLKASNTGAGDYFGCSVAISGDTVVVGTWQEDSNATGVNGDQSNNGANSSGAAYVFVRDGTTWSQQGYLKASNTDASDFFGYSVAISGDTVVIGARGEDSNATGVNGDETNNSKFLAGAAYVFVRDGVVWSQQAYLKASNTGSEDYFGSSVAVSGDTLVVGAPGEASSATGVNGDQSDNAAWGSGAAYVFIRSGDIWSQQAYLKASNAQGWDYFGTSVAVSGETVVIGAQEEDSNARGVNGSQANNDASNAGAAYVFVRGGSVWSQQAYLKASNTEAEDGFGLSVSVSEDTVVVGAPYEDSSAVGANGDQSNNGATLSGASYVFVRSAGVWTQQAYLKASNAEAQDYFGCCVALSDHTAVVSARREDSSAVGVDGDQSNNGAYDSGAAYVFSDVGGVWFQEAYLKASNCEASDWFGDPVAISGDTVVVGVHYEDSSATGVNGDQTDNSAQYAGAAYVFDGLAESPEAPTITGLAPTSGSESGGTLVTVTGTGFIGLSGPAAVMFAGQNAAYYRVLSSTQLVAVTPAHDPGPVQVQITAVGGQTPDSSVDDYTYVETSVPSHGRVSVSSGGSQGDNHSGIPAASADGRYVAFESWSSNLVAGDTNHTADVFVCDRETGVIERVSVTSGGGEANGISGNAAISADGRYVAFLSEATNFVAVGELIGCVHSRSV